MRASIAMLGAAVLLGGGGCVSPMYEHSVNPHEYSGVRLYQVFCSSCHGLTGHGDGPVEPYLKGGVPDLTKISARNGGKFPRERIRSVIDGRERFAAHGTAAMPVWGFEFHAGMSNDALALKRRDRMIDRLTSYLETLQPDYDD
jgi:mono/diheme cytochrome c family protein